MFFREDEFIDLLPMLSPPPGVAIPNVTLTLSALAALHARFTGLRQSTAILYLAPAVYTIPDPRKAYGIWQGDLVIPPWITTWMAPGAVLDVSSGARVVIDGPLNAGAVQIFEEPARWVTPGSEPSEDGMIILGGRLDAVLPEWWGARANGRTDDRDAIQRAIDASSLRREPTRWSDAHSEGVQVASPTQKEFRPRLPVRLSGMYLIGGPLIVGKEIPFPVPPPPSIDPVMFGRIGATAVTLRGLMSGGHSPSAGLVALQRFEGAAMVELRYALASVVQDLVLDASGVADRCLSAIGTDRQSAHSISIRRCVFRGAREVQLQIGAPVDSASAAQYIAWDDARRFVLGLSGETPEVQNVAIRVQWERDPQPGGDLVGLFVEDCEFDVTALPVRPALRLPRGIEFRALNAVAARFADLRFRGTASAFFDAVAGTALIEGCDFVNEWTPPPRKAVTGFQKTVGESRTEAIDLGKLGFEPPEGVDIYLRTDSYRTRSEDGAIAPSLVSTAVAMSGCVSRSAMVFDTVRPSPAIGARPDRSVWLTGILHIPKDTRTDTSPPSIRWGRGQIHTPLGTSIGSPQPMMGEPSLCIVGASAPRGVTVYYGAMQSLMLGVSEIGPSGENIRFEEFRAHFRRRTLVYGTPLMALTALLLLLAGCRRETGTAPPADAQTAVLDATFDDLADAGGHDDATTSERDASAPEDVSDSAVADAPEPRDVPPPSPPIQQRRNCPGALEGDPSIPSPRLIFPMSPMRATSRRPTFFWELPPGVTGARVELCRDPCCAHRITTLDAEGSSVRPTEMLPPGVVFWRARGRIGERVGRDVSFTWEVGIKHRDAPADTAWGTIKDFNGDGYDDVVTNYQVGRDDYLRVYSGSADGISQNRFADTRTPNSWSLSVGDFNGDGLADLAALGSEEDGMDRVAMSLRLFLGSPRGIIEDYRSIRVRPNGQIAVFDGNGDGFSDLALLSQLPGAINPRHADWIAAVYYGSPEGLQPEAYTMIMNPRREDRDSYFGDAVSAGDLNGDGYGDLVLTDPTYRGGLGRVYVMSGGANGVEAAPTATVDAPPEAWGAAGFGVRIGGVGDINGDRLGDFLISEGRRVITNLFIGDRRAMLMQGVRLVADDDFDRQTDPSRSFGGGTGISGDFDGDGRGELLVGCGNCLGPDAGDPLGNNNTTYGRIYIYSWREEGVLERRWEVRGYTYDQGAGTYPIGESLGSCGDVNGDGYDDFVYAVRAIFRGLSGSLVVNMGRATFGLESPIVIEGIGMPDGGGYGIGGDLAFRVLWTGRG